MRTCLHQRPRCTSAFNPDLILLSAGFDGAKNDIGNQKLNDCRVLQARAFARESFLSLTHSLM